jgi:hypothetical protein
MSRAIGTWAIARLTRRRVITIAASVGVGASAAGVTGFSVAGESTTKASADGPLVISLRDAKKGTFDVFSGGSKIELTDRKLAKRLQAVAARG